MSEKKSPVFPPAPSKLQIIEARKAWSVKMGRPMTSSHCAAMIYVTQRTWQKYESGESRMPPGLFELFRLKTGQF